jgi:hypothetical protein
LQERPHKRKDLRIVDRLVLVDQSIAQPRRRRERARKFGRENSKLPYLQEAAVVLVGNLTAELRDEMRVDVEGGFDRFLQ